MIKRFGVLKKIVASFAVWYVLFMGIVTHDQERVYVIEATVATTEEITVVYAEPAIIETATTEEPKPIGPIGPYSEDDLYLFAQIIECEVGGLGKEEMRCAGSVVLNRIRTKYRDFKKVNTLNEVLYQGYGTALQQYANPTINKIEGGIQPSDEAMEVAEGLLEGTLECLDEYILYQTEFVPNWNVEIIDMPGLHEVYSAPTDFQSCLESEEQ